MSQPIAPTSINERHLAMDLIRGIAVLGILLMNITAFGNSYAYYLNPYVDLAPTSIDLLTWHVTHILADQKFYTIFSILFGAGIMLMAQKAGNKGVSPTNIHYRRMGWLLIFGLIHGYFIWYGDILTIYAITGLWIYWLALKVQPKGKLIIGSLLIAVGGIAFAAMGLMINYMPAEESAQMMKMFHPDSTTLKTEIAAYQGDWWQQLSQRVSSFNQNLLGSIMFAPFRIGGGMLLGMAFYQMGILTGQRSKAFYLKFCLINFAIGFSLLAFDSYQLNHSQFSDQDLWFSFTFYNSFGSLAIAFGYIGLFCLWSKSQFLNRLKERLQAVGQMAFTNYIAQSILATGFFYGLNYFAQLERYQLYYVVLVIFALQLTWSQWWLKRYHFGPLEWLWRSLTYAKKQPFSKS